MPTSRTLGSLLAIGLVAAGCATVDDHVASLEGELGESPEAADIHEGSLEEEGVLLLVNDRATTASTLRDRAELDAAVASAIVAFRTDDAGHARWFASIDEVDAIPNTETETFRKLLGDARANGYVEAEGFDPPTSARLTVPDDLGRPPTSDDVTVEAGFDAKAPDEVASIVRSRITNVVDSSNERFVAETVRATHKMFTIAVGNLFAERSPHADFVKSLGADAITMFGTMSASHPTYLVAEKGGARHTYVRGDGGLYEEADDAAKAPAVMRAKIRLEPQGVRVFYPAWSAKVLAGPTAVIVEGGG